MHDMAKVMPASGVISIFTERAMRIASAVLATAIPSVTRRYCVKTTACSMVQFAPLDSHRFDTIPACFGRTDGQMVGIAVASTALAMHCGTL